MICTVLVLVQCNERKKCASFLCWFPVKQRCPLAEKGGSSQQHRSLPCGAISACMSAPAPRLVKSVVRVSSFSRPIPLVSQISTQSKIFVVLLALLSAAAHLLSCMRLDSSGEIDMKYLTTFGCCCCC
jgi:hypothetical protein